MSFKNTDLRLQLNPIGPELTNHLYDFVWWHVIKKLYIHIHISIHMLSLSFLSSSINPLNIPSACSVFPALIHWGHRISKGLTWPSPENQDYWHDLKATVPVSWWYSWCLGDLYTYHYNNPFVLLNERDSRTYFKITYQWLSARLQ